MGHYESTYAPVLPRNNPSFIFACTLASDDTSRSRRPIFKCRRKGNSQDGCFTLALFYWDVPGEGAIQRCPKNIARALCRKGVRFIT